MLNFFVWGNRSLIYDLTLMHLLDVLSIGTFDQVRVLSHRNRISSTQSDDDNTTRYFLLKLVGL